jgi:hypothetical protein
MVSNHEQPINLPRESDTEALNESMVNGSAVLR